MTNINKNQEVHGRKSTEIKKTGQCQRKRWKQSTKETTGEPHEQK